MAKRKGLARLFKGKTAKSKSTDEPIDKPTQYPDRPTKPSEIRIR